MAEDGQVLRAINWREAFGFTHIFRAFRIAVHPSKLLLALALLLTLDLGGWALDSVWPVRQMAIVVPAMSAGSQGTTEIDEFTAFQQESHTGETFAQRRQALRKGVEEMYVEKFLLPLNIYSDHEKAMDAAQRGANLTDVRQRLIAQRQAAIEAAGHARDAAPDKGEAQIKYDADVRDAYNATASAYRAACAIHGDGIFSQFFEYEVHQVNGVVNGVLAENWFGGIHGRPGSNGVFASANNFMAVGPLWLMRHHPAYFVAFTVLFMIVWSIFGGAVARIAAVHVARDEKTTLRQALRFSRGKFLSLIFAPVLPLLIVLSVGVIVLAGGLLGNIPLIGPPLVGLLFLFALAAGFVMALVLLGTAGGFNLMYPTIAVEGSDSFDAISRSFSYVYARPWRMLFYTVVAVMYGALTYEFVHLFVQLMLALTHYFVALGFVVHNPGTTMSTWEAMWPASGGRLRYDIDIISLRWDAALGARLAWFWVYIVIAMVGAFAISFYFCANTIIYYLMRREVDATEMDDVYTEQTEDDEEPAAAPPGPDAAADATAPA